MEAALYNVFMSASLSSFLSSNRWMAASLVLLMVTHSASFTHFGLWNTMSGISFSRSFFSFLRLQLGFVTLLADRMLLYNSWRTDMQTTFPPSSVFSTRLRNSICALISSILLCLNSGEYLLRRSMLVTWVAQHLLWYLILIACASPRSMAVASLTFSLSLPPLWTAVLRDWPAFL